MSTYNKKFLFLNKISQRMKVYKLITKKRTVGHNEIEESMTRPRFMEQCYEPGEKWPKPIFANKDRQLNIFITSRNSKPLV